MLPQYNPNQAADEQLLQSIFPIINGEAIPFYTQSHYAAEDLKAGTKSNVAFWSTLPGHSDCTLGIRCNDPERMMPKRYAGVQDTWLILRPETDSLWLPDGTIQYEWGEVYLVFLKSYTVLCYLGSAKDKSKKKTHIQLHFENSSYGSIEVDVKKHIKGLYRVVTDIAINRRAY